MSCPPFTTTFEQLDGRPARCTVLGPSQRTRAGNMRSGKAIWLRTVWCWVDGEDCPRRIAEARLANVPARESRPFNLERREAPGVLGSLRLRRCG